MASLSVALHRRRRATKDRFRNLARVARTFSSHPAEVPAEFVEQLADMKIGKRVLRRLKKIRILR